MDKITNNILNNIQKNDIKGTKKPAIDNNAKSSLDNNDLGSNVVDIKKTKVNAYKAKSLLSESEQNLIKFNLKSYLQW